MEFESNKPIYLQIMDYIKMNIISGKWLPGERIGSVRELAAALSVNPNTVQRALGDLEREGLVYSVRTSGRFITEDRRLIDQMRKEMAEKEIRKFISQMKDIGYDKKEIIQLIEKEGDI